MKQLNQSTTYTLLYFPSCDKSSVAEGLVRSHEGDGEGGGEGVGGREEFQEGLRLELYGVLPRLRAIKSRWSSVLRLYGGGVADSYRITMDSWP